MDKVLDQPQLLQKRELWKRQGRGGSGASAKQKTSFSSLDGLKMTWMVELESPLSNKLLRSCLDTVLRRYTTRHGAPMDEQLALLASLTGCDLETCRAALARASGEPNRAAELLGDMDSSP